MDMAASGDTTQPDSLELESSELVHELPHDAIAGRTTRT